MKLSIVLLSSIILCMGCDEKEKSQASIQNNVSIESKASELNLPNVLDDESSVRLAESILIDDIDDLITKGVIGKWKCDFTGYESIISLVEKDSQKVIEIDFTKSKMKTKTEDIVKKGNKYLVVESKVNEYYIITDSGNLELWDKDGIFTTAVNIMHGQDVFKKLEIDLEKIIGQDIYLQ